MIKRLISLILCACLVLGLIFPGSVRARAVSNMTCSEDGIATLKSMEGFSKFPYKDGGQYTVGYGTGCAAEDLERYQRDGISEAEADTLLRTYLEKMEAAVNSFADKNGLQFTQSRFDAMMLFTFNVGTGWLNASSDLRTAVISGAATNDFLFYFVRWCVSDGEINTGLIKRRLAEADLYLNGNYGVSAPAYYAYVLLDANGGTVSSGVQGYDASDPPAVKAKATKADSEFLGWYTEKDGGIRVDTLDTTTAGKTLYARWQSKESQGEAVNYQRQVTVDTDLYQLDGSAAVVGKVKAGETVTITKEYIDGKGTRWGQVEGGWIDLKDTAQPVVKAEKPQKANLTVSVTNEFVNVRKGPGTTYAQVGKVYYGDQLVISETAVVNNVTWGKFSGGWLSLQYTNYASIKGDDTSVPPATQPDSDNNTNTPEPIIAVGTVKQCGLLRIRSGPGTSYPQVGNLTEGTYVEITQRQMVGAAEWGKIDKGWICLTYVQLHEQKEETPAPDAGTEPAPDNSTDSGNQTPSQNQTGTVVNCQVLNVRSGPGTHNAKVTTLARGAKVEILEISAYNNQPWARIKEGWVAMSYIQLDFHSSQMGDGKGVTGTVYNCNKLNVRRSPGTNSTPVGYLLPGNTVTIYEETTVGNMHWGRMDQGWVCMDYIRLSNSGPADTGVPEPGVEGSRTGVVVGTNALRIRSGAGTTYAQVGTLNMGAIVIIYDQTTVKGVAWGRTDKGWVCMDYIRLDAEDGSFTGTVSTNGLKIRSAAGVSNAILGTYQMGDKVTILETTSVSGVAWGRTDKGWICLHYVIR